ncbi:hypothetical protein [Sabulibacter ruber]|uniref:hypothetical protein n=1 Tax=Sabulibacter ruber TaxID=2811901 RepID=UPI001A965038|nr:hypothetical protein [Sabulibacter ruber]
MKQLLLIAFMLLAWQYGFGQRLSQEELVNFYESAISDYYSDNIFNQEEKEHLILSDSLPNGIRLTYPRFTLKPVTEDAAVQIIEGRKGKSGRLDKIFFKEISPDTVDINIGGWSVTVKRVFRIYKGRLITKDINFAVGCGGTMGYIPNARLVYNRESRKWDYYSYATLLEKRKAELETRRK